MAAGSLDNLTEAVASHLALPPGDGQRVQLAGPCAAAHDLVAGYHGLSNDEEWPSAIWQGTVMLAAKLHRRRNSPDTITNDQGYGPMYVAKYDPDISMLLGLDRHMKPKAI